MTEYFPTSNVTFFTKDLADNVYIIAYCFTGATWMQCFVDSLSPEARSSITREVGSKVFRFGGGKICKSIKCVEVPCQVAGHNVIPILLSKEAMKKAQLELNLVSDKSEIFGKKHV